MLRNYFLYWPCGTNHRCCVTRPTRPAPFGAFVEGGTNKDNHLYIVTIPLLKLHV